MEKVHLKIGTPIFHEIYKGLEIYEEFIPRNSGYDPAPFIWYARPPGKEKVKWTFFAYSESALKKQILEGLNKRTIPKRRLRRK